MWFRHGKQKMKGHGMAMFWVTGNTSYLIMGEKSLVRLAKLAGETEMAARRQVFIDKAVQAMRTYMWDEHAVTFLSVKKETMEKIPVANNWQLDSTCSWSSY
ncbi:hypothetical protein FW778_19675 [Ginsengibacter hankyongi]|uniref:Mannosylglycerate hydrolase MGH1-like glycoside hydrolase domain-containing protein n=1 Tax=Ginsengibacter hankyongi TaxID=2607284 RepID=A0A5J5IBF1_9BACT|nr:hypothetical protein [Ginsengibacter hankyongi]KAA9036109.1 hypothetical protein FW778_19675 [Ginsengibacter hankyongi]